MDRRINHRWWLAGSWAAVLVGLGAALLYCFPVYLSQPLDVSRINHWGGNAYAITVSELLPEGHAAALLGIRPDSNESPAVSSLRLLENGNRVGSPHSIHDDITGKGEARFSHWNDTLLFSTTDNSDPRRNGRSYAIRYSLSPPWWIAALLLVAGGAGLSTVAGAKEAGVSGTAKTEGKLLRLSQVVVRYAARGRAHLFWTAAAILAVHLNVVVFRLLPAPLPFPDSQGYLAWSLLRTVGYPLLLEAYHLAFRTWEYLPLFQLNLMLAGLLVLAYAIARVTGSYVVGWFFLALVTAAGNMLVSVADVLTEAPFSALVMLHLGCFTLLLDRGRKLTALLAGLALSGAILVKSVAVVLIGPLVLFLFFLPPMRRLIFALVLGPAVLAWVGPSVYNYARNGFFESSISGGFALGGHVAWGIRAHEGSAYAEEARLIEQRLRPILAERPEGFGSIDEYVNYTTNEYNTLLWANIVPELAGYYRPLCVGDRTCTWSRCPARCIRQINRALLGLSKEAIAHEPRNYAYHVAVHDYGMWRDVFASSIDVLEGVRRRSEWLDAAYDPKSSDYLARLGPLPRFKSHAERADIVADLEESSGKRALDLISLRDVPMAIIDWAIARHPKLMFLLGLVASLLVFRLSRITPVARACCYAALCLNAYTLGTALAQPTLVRYAWAAQGVMAAFLVLGAFLVCRAAGGRIKAAVGKLEPGSTSQAGN